MSAEPVDEIVAATTGTTTLNEAARLLNVERSQLAALVRALNIPNAGEVRTPGKPGRPVKTYRINTLTRLVVAVKPFDGVM